MDNIDEDYLTICSRLQLLKNTLQTSTQKKVHGVLRIAITGASNIISYVLVRELAKGVFGENQVINLVLMDEEPMLNVMRGFAMEIKDCLLPLIKSVEVTSDLSTALRDTDLIIFTPSETFNKNDCETDTWEKHTNSSIATLNLFKNYAKLVGVHAKSNLKILVVSEPVHLNAYILSKYSNTIQAHNIVCFSRLAINQFVSHVWKTNRVKSTELRNIFTWGFNNQSFLPDTSVAIVNRLDEWLPWSRVIDGDNYVKNYMSSFKSMDEIKDELNFQTFGVVAISKAICDQLRDWYQGTKGDDVVNMCVASDGSYDVPIGTFWNFPVTIKNGFIRIKNDLQLDPLTKEYLEEEMIKCFKEMNQIFSKKPFADDYDRLGVVYKGCP